MRICLKCNNEVDDRSRFCHICGTKIVNEDESRIWSVKEFSEAYRIGINTAYEMAHARDFPKVKKGKKIFILKSKIDEWFEKNIGRTF